MSEDQDEDARRLQKLLQISGEAPQAFRSRLITSYREWLRVTGYGRADTLDDAFSITQSVLFLETEGDALSVHPSALRNEEIRQQARSLAVTEDDLRLVFRWWHESGKRVITSK